MSKSDHQQQIQDEVIIKQARDDKQLMPCYSIFLVIVLITIYFLQRRYQIYSRFLQCNIFALLNYRVWTIITTCFGDHSFAIVFLFTASCKTFIGRFVINYLIPGIEKCIFAISIAIQLMLIGAQAALLAFLWITQHRKQIQSMQFHYWEFYILRNSVGMGAVWINMVYKICFTVSSDKIGYAKPFFNLQCSRIVNNLKFLSWIIFVIAIEMTFIGLGQLRLDIILGFLLAIIECWLFKGGLVKYTLQTYVIRQKWAKKLGLEKWQRFVSFVIVDYEQNKYMALEPIQFYDNMIRKINNRHHIVDSYAGYQRNADEVGLKTLESQQTQE